MPSIENIVPILVLAVIGFFAWRYFTTGSLVGAMLGSRIKETIGELELKSSRFGSQVIKIHVLEAKVGGPPDIAMAITSKAAMSASMVPFKLSQAEARQLIELLQRAASH